MALVLFSAAISAVPTTVAFAGEDPMFPARATSRDPHPPPDESREPKSLPDDSALHANAPPSRVEFEAQLLAVNRSLSYVHLVGSDLRGHEVSLAPALGFAARVFPMPVGVPVVSDLGLHFEYWQSLGLESSRVDGGPKLPTRFTSFELGLRYRYDGRALLPGLELTPLAAFRSTRLVLGSSGSGSEPDVPNLDYFGAKLGLEGRVGVQGPVRIEAELAYLPVFSAGSEVESGRFFDEASGYGVSVRARFGMRFAERWLLLLGAELMSYSLELVPGARSAVQLSDRLLGVSVGLRVIDPLTGE